MSAEDHLTPDKNHKAGAGDMGFQNTGGAADTLQPPCRRSRDPVIRYHEFAYMIWAKKPGFSG